MGVPKYSFGLSRLPWSKVDLTRMWAVSKRRPASPCAVPPAAAASDSRERWAGRARSLEAHPLLGSFQHMTSCIHETRLKPCLFTFRLSLTLPSEHMTNHTRATLQTDQASV